MKLKELYEAMKNELTNQVEVPVAFLENLSADIAKLNRRANKIGMNTVQLTLSTPYANDDGIQVVKASIVGKPVKIGNFTFLGKVEMVEGTTFIAPVPGATLPEWARQSDPSRCDHCGKVRRRIDAFFVQNDATGEILQIGRTCLKDYLGVDANKFIAYWSYIRDMEEFVSNLDDELREGGSRFANFLEVRRVLAITNAVVNSFGWVSKTNGDEAKTPTYVWVQEILNGNPRLASEVNLGEDDYHAAQKVIDWIKSWDDAKLNDYQFNLWNMVRNGHVQSNRMPFLASAIASYNRHLEFEAEKVRKTQNAPSQFFGTVGKREEFYLTVTSFKYLDSIYGLTTLVSFIDDNGNVGKWFASGHKEFELNSRLHVKATVKKHEVYQNQNQTTLTRVSIIP